MIWSLVPMISLPAVVLLLVLHWFADFVLQNDKMALNKSTSNKWLGVHVAVYTAVMAIFGWKFALVNGAIHFGVDFVTSRLTTKLFKEGNRHDFFVVIGLDQLIHMLTLIITYWKMN